MFSSHIWNINLLTNIENSNVCSKAINYRTLCCCKLGIIFILFSEMFALLLLCTRTTSWYTFTKIHENIIDYIYKLDKNDIALLDPFQTILADMDFAEFNDKKLNEVRFFFFKLYYKLSIFIINLHSESSGLQFPLIKCQP